MDSLATSVSAQHCISALTTVEIRSAIRRLEAFGDITHAGAALGIQRLNSELAHFQITDVSASVIAKARRVVDSTQLRALDAIQLATALLVMEANQDSTFILVASDRKLLEAAQANGLATLKPEEPTL